MILELESALRDCLNGHGDERYANISLERRGERLELMSCWRYFRLHNHRLLLVRGVNEEFVQTRLLPLAEKISGSAPDFIIPGWDSEKLILLFGFSLQQVLRPWPDPETKPTSVLAWQMR